MDDKEKTMLIKHIAVIAVVFLFFGCNPFSFVLGLLACWFYHKYLGGKNG